MHCNHHLRASLAMLVIPLLSVVVDFGSAFTASPAFARRQSTTTTTALDLFGNALKDAFKNDDALGKAENPGLKNGPNYNENVFVNGKPVSGSVVGQKLTVVAGRARVKIPVNCQKGDCGTCEVKLNGRKVRACQTSLPSGRANIDTL